MSSTGYFRASNEDLSGLAVIVACLGSFRSLFIRQETRFPPIRKTHASPKNIKIPLRTFQGSKTRNVIDSPDLTTATLVRAQYDGKTSGLRVTWVGSQEEIVPAERPLEDMV